MQPANNQGMQTGLGAPYATKIKTMCKKDLLLQYGITYKTLRHWLKILESELGPINGRYLTVVQLKIIFEAYGYPGEE